MRTRELVEKQPQSIFRPRAILMMAAMMKTTSIPEMMTDAPSVLVPRMSATPTKSSSHGRKIALKFTPYEIKTVRISG